MNNELIEFTRQFLLASHVSSRRVTPPCEDWSWMDLGLRAGILGMENYNNTVENWLKNFQPQKIYHLTDEFQCSYTVLMLPESDEYLIIGPVLFEQIKQDRFDELFGQLGLPAELRKELEQYYYRVPFLPLHGSYESIFTILCDHLFGENNYEVIYTDVKDLDEWYQFHQNYLRIPDKPFLGIHMIEERYDLENRLLNMVRNANETKALEAASQLCCLTMPQRLPNSLRDHKDYCITVNSLLRKESERAGVHPIHIDSFSNRNIQVIEQLTSLEQCLNFIRRLVRGYCRLVREHNLKSYSLLAQKAITYINTDLRADLSLKSLSEHLSVNPNYLSTLFKKEMGMPLTDYVNHRRIEQAQRMLLSTDMPIKSVALQCGIPDVAYFSRLFKRIVGFSPKVYRETGTFDDLNRPKSDT